ncbi:MAG: hypothetical protein QXI56_04285 [Candidatus Bathyarchaeia archaeon]
MLQLLCDPRTKAGLRLLLVFALVGVNFLVYAYGSTIQNSNEYNLFLITALSLIGVGLSIDFLKNGYVNNTRKLSPFAFLVPSLIMMMLVIRNTNLQFIRLWHTYYTVRSAASVSLSGSMSELASIFENFASSFATPVSLAIISTVTNLEIIICFSLFGMIVFITVLTPLIYRLCQNTGAINIRILHIAFFLSLGGVLFAPQFFIYLHVGFALLILAFYCYNRIIISGKSRIGNHSFIITFILATLGSSIHYLPGALLFAGVFLTLAGVMMLLSRSRLNELAPSYIRYAVLFFVIVASYFMYYGHSFYEDIRIYLETISSFFHPEPFIIYTPERLELLDAITAFVIQVTRLRYLVTFIYLFGFFQVIKRAKSSILAKAMGTVSTGFAILAYSSIFIHTITDYAYRLHLYLISIGTLTLYFGIELLYTFKGKYKLLTITFLSLVFISNMFAFIHNLMLPATPPWASDARYYAEEAFVASTFVANHITTSPPKTIVANYRYGYISSVWGTRMSELSDWLLKQFIEADSIILMLTSLNFKAPDKSIRRLTNFDYSLIVSKANLIYNSNITYVLLR